MKSILSLIIASISAMIYAQCDSIQVNADMVISTDQILSGTYVVDGDFVVQSGVTVFIEPYSSGSCGALKVYADNIVIEGDINGNFAGYNGGTGGSKGLSVTSVTGHAASLTTCNDSGTQGHVNIEGGKAGMNGEGPGGGLAGVDGANGSGSKQYCGNFGDEAGLIGGSGGAGGGSGGTYGGVGGAGENGGAGTNSATVADLDIEDSYAAVAGAGGIGGMQSSSYGSLSGRDIALGSGGAGAGGGARSFYLGSDGFAGGNGGGLVYLMANNVTISGNIMMNGQDGSYGGNGGSGDATEDCCSDGCNGCDERTFSCGSGAGSGSGGGSGGGIFIESLGIADIQGTLSAKGGSGGLSGQKGNGANCIYGGGGFCSSNSISTSDGDLGGEGGAGGGGRIKIYTAECAQPNLSPTIELNGGSGANPGTEGTYAEVCGYASLASNKPALHINAFPNPFNDELVIQLPETVSHSNKAQVCIVNTLGTVLISETFITSSNKLSLSELNSGIYIIQLIHQEKMTSQKIIKQ